MPTLDTTLLTSPYTRTVTTASVSRMLPLNSAVNVAVAPVIVIDIIGIPDVNDTEILLYDGDLGTLVIYDAGAFTANATASSVVFAGGIYTFTFTPAVNLPWRDTCLVGAYDIGVEIGFVSFTTVVNPEITAGWLDPMAIETHFGTSLTNFPNMEAFRAAIVPACITDPSRTEIAYKRLAELLHVTELGDALASRSSTVVPQHTGGYRGVSTSASTILTTVTANERYFINGVTELELAGLSRFWLDLIRGHYHGPSRAHKLSAVSLALHLAVMLENSLA